MINLSFFNKKIKKQNYLGLLLKEQEGILMVLSKRQGQLFVKDKINFSYSNGFENLTEDVDENLTLLNLEKEEINQLIIFAYSNLVDQSNKQIKSALLSSLKRMIKELAFIPLGYIEVSEAVVYYLEQNDNLPLNAILVEIDKTQVSVFVYKGGQIILKKLVSRTDNFIDDLLTVFKEKGKEFLPSRIILYNSKDLDEKVESIVSYRWPTDYFIQLPKVNIIKEEELLKACVFVFEFQLKEEVSDLSKNNNKENKEEKMGFFIGKDIAQEASFEKKDNFFKIFHYFYFKAPLFLSSWFSFFKIPFKIRLLGFFFPFFIFFFFLLLAVFINEWFFHNLSLDIYPEKKLVEKEVVLLGSLDKKMTSDKLNIIIKEQEFSLSSSKKTTGQKDIGQQARGEVTIFNNDLSSSHTLSKGTVLISENGLKFFLEEEVKIASASGDASNPKPATAKVQVIASSIGSEYNLSSGNKFLIEGKSQNLIAKNESSFSGGTKNKVKTVSKDDFEELRKQIKEKSKIKQPIFEKNKKIVNELTEINLKEENFSKEINEEAEEITLNAKINKKFYLYDENQLKNKAIFFLKKEIPKDFEIEKNTIKYNLIKAKIEKDNLVFNFKISGQAIKKIDIDSLKKDLVFVSKRKMTDVLKDKYKIMNYNFRISSGFLIFEITPFFKKNIEIKVSY